MDFMEEVKETMESVAQTVVKKSSELMETAKLKYSIFDLRSDIKKLYNEIGVLTYGSIENNEDNAEDIKMKCSIIKAKYARIEALEKNGEDAEFACPVCGKPNDISNTHCSSCGANMTIDAVAEVNHGE